MLRRLYRPFAPRVDHAAIEHVRRLAARSESNGAFSPAVRTAIVEQFHELYYGELAWRNTSYRGVETWKCPLDLWTYQEICHELRPSLVVETGTAYGGSGYFFADLCETLGHGEVLTIDVADFPDRPRHERLTYFSGSSVAPETLAYVESRLPADGHVLVLLDSDHSRDHVLAELRAYSPLVTKGSYCVVEDTNVNGHPVFAGHGPGPMEAVDAFLGENRDFVVDASREKFFLTFNPRGFLKRVEP